MTKRVIKTTVGTYVGKRGGEPFVGAYGWQGDEVDVHEDYLDEFDEHNVENGDGKPVEYERVGVSVISPETVAAQEKADKEKADAEEAAQKRAVEEEAAEKKAAEKKAADEQKAAAAEEKKTAAKRA